MYKSLIALQVLKTSVARDIRQLVISPDGTLMLIVTTHTVHVAVLPDPSHLENDGSYAVKAKTFMLGPTVHVLSESPIVSVLWHPLDLRSRALVTLTEDAEVRLWEIDVDDRSSFEYPTIAVDLRLLANATSCEDSFQIPNRRRNRVFSPDAVEMQVTSACFGGKGHVEENGWAPMTLWVAMTEGDVYALCPLLPSEWTPPSTLIPSLSISVTSNMNLAQVDQGLSSDIQHKYKDQLRWMTEIDNQEATYVQGAADFVPEMPIYARPRYPSAIPRLQGPFQLSIHGEDGPQEDLHLSDIYAIAAKIKRDDIMFEEEEEIDIEGLENSGLSMGIVCLLTSNGEVRICLDIDGVEGDWLPERSVSLSRHETNLAFIDVIF